MNTILVVRVKIPNADLINHVAVAWDLKQAHDAIVDIIKDQWKHTSPLIYVPNPMTLKQQRWTSTLTLSTWFGKGFNPYHGSAKGLQYRINEVPVPYKNEPYEIYRDQIKCGNTVLKSETPIEFIIIPEQEISYRAVCPNLKSSGHGNTEEEAIRELEEDIVFQYKALVRGSDFKGIYAEENLAKIYERVFSESNT